MIQRPPRFPKNKVAKILYATQIAVDAPTFVIFVNHKSRVNFAFKKWVENTIRKHFGFVGVPIVVKYRNRDEENDDHPISNNPYNNKGKRKREKSIELSTTPTSTSSRSISSSRKDTSIKHPNSTKRTPPKREGKYSNIKTGSQKRLDTMFRKVYGEKQTKKKATHR
ncbi:MAG: hypothetical protein LBG59_09410 [Candidatus Peribacteria bacterium]|jgi:hypothetical protein|nr:hypothetical protein [Candidatus Peribacteria bacterium]